MRTYAASASPLGCTTFGIAKTGRSPRTRAEPAQPARCQSNGDERARPELEKKQLDREKHGRDRAAERSRHARRRARCKQRLPLVGGDVQHLPDNEPRAPRSR